MLLITNLYVFPWVPYPTRTFFRLHIDWKMVMLRWIIHLKRFQSLIFSCGFRCNAIYFFWIYSSFIGICYGISPPATNFVNDCNKILTKTAFSQRVYNLKSVQFMKWLQSKWAIIIEYWLDQNWNGICW